MLSACVVAESVVAVSSPMRRTLETCLIARSKLKKGAFRNIVVVDDARERFGLHICDSLRRYDRAAAFPDVDRSRSAAAEQDPAKVDCRETYHDLLLRAARLVCTLRDLNEPEIVVFSHSSFLLALFNGVLQTEDAELRRPFTTGEVRSVRISFA